MENGESRDGEVRGAKLKLVSKGKPVFMKRAVQKLFPLEVCSVTGEIQGNVGPGEEVGPGSQYGVRHIPKQAAVLDWRWRTRSMINH